MITLAAFGDIVKQAGEIEQSGIGEVLEYATGQGELMAVVRHRQAPHVTDDEQGVLVDRVGMEQVVLHTPDDGVERRYVSGEDTVTVHAPEFMGDAT